MNRLSDFIIEHILLPVIFLLIGFLFVGIYYEAETKSALYSECLETEYNKFQCYSMIYGDK